MTDDLSDLRAITVRQPLASAIFRTTWRRKDIENRSWPTNYRGRLYIHAGRKINWEAADRAWPEDHEGNLPLGAIIGWVTLKDCIRAHPSPWAEPEQYHWILGEPMKLLDKPVPCRGALGLWRIPQAVWH